MLDLFGHSVASTPDGDIIVGAILDDTDAADAGSAYLFDGTTGDLLLTINNPTPEENDQFGHSLTSTPDGDILVGARFDDTDAADAGSAYLFDGTTGDLLLTINNPTPENPENFGDSVASTPNGNIIVGAKNDNTNAPNTGSAYLFDGTTGDLLLTINNPVPVIGAFFGRSVASTSDGKIIVGAENGNFPFPGLGAAYLFEEISTEESSTGKTVGDWFNTDWQNRKQITIPQVPYTLTDFPVLISLTDPELNSSRFNGFDFVVTSGDGITEIPYEREKWDKTTDELVIWIKVSTLKNFEDTILYLYYNNPNQTTDKSNPTNVWTNGFADVWHLDNGFILQDSANINHGTNDGSVSTPGKIGDARDFDGVDDKVTFGNVGLDGSAQMSKSIWFKTTDTSNGFFDIEYGAASDVGFGIPSGNGGLQTRLGFQNNPTQTIIITPSLEAADGNWHQVFFTYDGIIYKAYFDGIESGTPISIADTIKHNFETTLGKRTLTDTNRLYNGVLDEVRIYDTAKSADWIATEWNNQNDPSSFYDIGPEEDKPLELSLESLQMQINDIINGVTAIAVDWFDITNRPAGLDDGDDDTLAGLGCTTDQIAKYDGTEWVCANDEQGSISIPIITNGAGVGEGSIAFAGIGGGVISGGVTEEELFDRVSMLMPSNGTINNLFAFAAENAPGSGESYEMTLFKNHAETSLSCTISNNDRECTGSTDDINILAGDKVAIKFTSTSLSNPSLINSSFEFTTP